MCYPKPGPRCSAHAREALLRAEENERLASKNIFTGNQWGEEHYLKTKQKLVDAQNAYDMTPAGILELERRSKGRHTEEYVERLELARVRRAEALAAIGIAKDRGDTNTPKNRYSGVNPLVRMIKREFQNSDEVREGWGRRAGEGDEDRIVVRKEAHRISNKWMRSLTPEEIEAVAWATSNGSSVMSSHAQGQEHDIWGHDVYSPEFISNARKNFNSAMSKAPKSKTPIILYRGVNDGMPEGYGKDWEVGKEVTLPSHSPATLDPFVARAFTQFREPTVLEFKTNRIASTASMSAWGASEMEVLIDAQTKWKVVGIQEGVNYGRESDEDNYRVIQLEPME